MKKLLKAFATVAALAMLGTSFMACASDDGGSSGGSGETAKLVKFNAAETEWAATDMVVKGSASSGGAEGYLVFNHKIELDKEDVVIEADVSFTSLSGHVGLGFISVDGSDRKGYSLLTGQNIKNVNATLGGGGNGLTPSVTWAVNKPYHFKVVFDHTKYSDSESPETSIVYTVTDENGVESTNTTPMYYSLADVVYPAFGGTTASNAKYSNIKISVGSKKYSLNGLDEQSVLSALSVSTTSVRLLLNNSETVTYTSTASGSAAGVLLDYDATKLEVADDGNGSLTVKGIAPTTGTTLKIINKGATYIAAPVTVVVEDFNNEDAYGALTTVYPANAATGVFEDDSLRITFDDVPVVSATGSVSIYDADTGDWVDTIKASDEEIEVPSGKNQAATPIKVKGQMIRVEGNSVIITPHYGALKAGKTYYVAIPKDVITAKLNEKDFAGLTINKDNASWKFTVRAAPTVGSTISVNGAESSSADFRTVHGALLAIGSSTGDYVINVAPGTYRELVHFNGGANITINGTGSAKRGADTVIQWTNLNKYNGSMDTRAVMYFGDTAGNVILNNIKIVNTCDRSKEGTADTQAEALYYKSSKNLAVNNCTFLSHQDTICTRGKTWFYDCYIEGDTDFLWGYSDVALFEKCDLVCLYDDAKNANSNYSVLFVARTGTKSAAKLGKGYVLLNSTVKVNDGVTNYLGRNAGSGDFYDQIALVNVAFTNEGTGTTSTDLWRDANVYDYKNGKEDKVGLKYYGLTGDIDTSAKIDHVAKISAEDYALEFNGRRAILNRAYKVEDDAYVASVTFAEDYLTNLESSFSAEADASKDNDYGVQSKNKEYGFGPSALVTEDIQATTKVVDDILTIDASTAKVGKHEEKYGAYFNAGSKLVFTLTTPAVIELDVTYVNSGAKIQLDDDAEGAVASAVGKISFPVAAGSHTITFIGNQTYVKTATLVLDEFEYGFGPSALVTEDIQATTKVVDDILTIDASTAKVGKHEEKYGAYFNAGSKLVFTLEKASVITLDVTYVNSGAKIQLDDDAEGAVASAVGKISFPVAAGSHTITFIENQTYVKTATILK